MMGAVRRGLGVPVLKSELFWLVSCEPLNLRKIAVVASGVGACPAPSKQSAEVPYPTKSTMSGSTPLGQPPLRLIELFTSATLPELALRLMSPEILGLTGNGAPLFPSEARPTRKYSPGAMMPPNGCLLD